MTTNSIDLQSSRTAKGERIEGKVHTHIGPCDDMHTFPQYVRSIKERECWILFQKMVAKGISVSYETIMRGMLTPTEVRAMEKKRKEVVERQASLDLEAAASDSKK